MCVTSPPYYGLRDYGVAGQIGLEETPQAYIETMVAVFRELRRVLRKDGTLWLNMGSSYMGGGPHHGDKNLGKSGTNKGSRTGRDRVSDGKNPIRSRRPLRDQACDSGGIEQSDCSALGSAYSGRDDGLLNGSQSHHADSLRNGLAHQPEPWPCAPIAHDSEHLDCAADLSSIALLAARLSNNPALPESARDAFSQAAKVSAFLSSPQTFSPDAQAFSHSSCGCGSCGICFTYLAMNALRFKPKDLMMIPDLLALALQADGWWLRSEITWAKRAPMPESVTDRPTSATEKVFLLAKSKTYYYDAEAVKEPSETEGDTRHLRTDTTKECARPDNGSRQRTGNPQAANRNLRNWWLLSPEPFSGWTETVRQVRVERDAPGDGKKAEKTSHFATFPTEIPRRAILAGTSEKGVCPKCGAPWVRIVKKSGGTIGKGSWNDDARLTAHRDSGIGDHRRAAGDGWDSDYKVETLGWQPACRCDAGAPIPATILDPFFGAGTTGLVADQLGRDCIGIELNPKYADMSRNRISDDAGMFAHVEMT